MKILLTGGTGSFGKALIRAVGQQHTIRVYSRGELLQADASEEFTDEAGYDCHFMIGDVRDRDRLIRAARGVDVIIHAAAMKRIEKCEYDPWEAVQTNVGGAQNVIDAAYAWDVPRVVALSTDKAVHPVNLYGATKLCAEKIIRNAGHTVVRYGNVMGSRGSVVHAFRSQAPHGFLKITDPRMTRFCMTMDEAVQAVWHTVTSGGTYEGTTAPGLVVPRLPSMRVAELTTAMYPGLPVKVTGIRQGEKLHEMLLTPEEGGPYTSDNNDRWYTVDELRELVANV